MKKILSFFLALTLLISLAALPTKAKERVGSEADRDIQTGSPSNAKEPEEAISDTTLIGTGQELASWLLAHSQTYGTARLTADVSLPQNFDFAYLGEDFLTIETGPFTLSTSGFSDIVGVILEGEGVDGPVLSGKSVTLSRSAITATGRDGIGGTAVHVTGNLSIHNTEIAAFGENAVGAESASVLGNKGAISAEGEASVALRLHPPADTSYYSPGELKFFTIQAVGEHAVSVEADGAARNLVFTECQISPAVDFGEDGSLEPVDNWNTFIQLASPSEGYRPPDSVTVNFKSALGYATAELIWPDNLPDFRVPGIYELTATVSGCELPSLIGEDYSLTVQIGDHLAPVFNAPSPQYEKGSLRKLLFPVPASHTDAGLLTGLWYSPDNGRTWKVGVDGAWRRFDLGVSGFTRETPYLLVLESKQDGVMDGQSRVWELTIHQDESYSFVPTELPPPALIPREAVVSSWEELLFLAADEDRTETNYRVTADLTVDGYVELQSKTPTLSLDMGDHGITVKNGGWLILDVDELRGFGTDKPLITVEPGGSLVLGCNTFYSYGMGHMNITAMGRGDLGGVAVEIQEGAYFAAINHPNVTAQGNGAVAVRSRSLERFSLPVGLSLYAEGENASALETSGDADLFYVSAHASGDGARAVRTPLGSSTVIESADVSPLPENADLRTAILLGFNQDMEQPQILWLAKEQGLYLPDNPVLATVARSKNPDDTAAIWVDCEWDTGDTDFTAVGNYSASRRFSPLLPVTIDGLPVEKSVSVAVKDPTGKPDISLVYPLPPVSVGGGLASYGFYIVPNSYYTEDISALWCSADGGDTWVKAHTLLDVFMPPSFTAGSDNLIYVTGLTPGKTYLFKLESDGRSGEGDGPFAGAGVSKVRQIMVSGSGKVVNLDWSGDRDGGDTDGNQPTETGDSGPGPENSGSLKTLTPAQTPETPPAPGTEPTTPPPAASALLQDKPAAAPATPVPSPAESGATYSRLSGIQLRRMAVNGEVQFSKQGITVTLAADALEALSIADDSVFYIEIERHSGNDFSFLVAVDDVEANELAGTRVVLPYAPSGETPVIALRSDQNEAVFTGSYDNMRQLASFTVDTTGHFTIAEQSSATKILSPKTVEISASSPPPKAQARVAVFLLPGVVLLGFCGLFLWKRSKKT